VDGKEEDKKPNQNIKNLCAVEGKPGKPTGLKGEKKVKHRWRGLKERKNALIFGKKKGQRPSNQYTWKKRVLERE